MWSGREVCVTGESLVRRSPTECDVSECDLETSTIRRSRPARAVEPCKERHIECGSLLRVVGLLVLGRSAE